MKDGYYGIRFRLLQLRLAIVPVRCCRLNSVRATIMTAMSSLDDRTPLRQLMAKYMASKGMNAVLRPETSFCRAGFMFNVAIVHDVP